MVKKVIPFPQKVRSVTAPQMAKNIPEAVRIKPSPLAPRFRGDRGHGIASQQTAQTLPFLNTSR
jgi:hypothetical protein